MRRRQRLETDLNLIRGFAGRNKRISIKRSSSSAIASADDDFSGDGSLQDAAELILKHINSCVVIRMGGLWYLRFSLWNKRVFALIYWREWSTDTPFMSIGQ